MAAQSIVADRIVKNHQTGEIHFVLSPKTDEVACKVAGKIDDDGNLTDVHCENKSCKKGNECNLQEEPDPDNPNLIHYYCTCDPSN
jgi:hypothetical protein